MNGLLKVRGLSLGCGIGYQVMRRLKTVVLVETKQKSSARSVVAEAKSSQLVVRAETRERNSQKAQSFQGIVSQCQNPSE